MIFSEYNKSDWEQMANYLSGEMDNNKRIEFQERINFSEENKAYFNQVKKDWEQMNNIKKEEKIFDSNKAWDKLYTKFEHDGLIESKKEVKVINLNQILRIVAVFIFGAALASLVYYLNPGSVKDSWKLADSYNSKDIKEIKLSDGSVVYLNADSKLYYPEQFSGSTRTVEFEGDAFFSIAKNPSKPFIIKAKKAEIKVVGTSFNVNTNSGINKVEVLVETGIVQLKEIDKDKSIPIEPGFIGKLDKNGPTKQKNADVNYMAWKTRIFDFENVKLEEVIEILNRTYHANIHCSDNSIVNKKIYGRFNDESLNTILNIICSTYDLQYKPENNKIVLSPE